MFLNATHHVRSRASEDSDVAVNRTRPARDRTTLLRLLATTAALIWLGSNRTTAQAVKIPRPTPEFFSFATLTVSASPTAISFTLVHSGIAAASSAITITTAYTGGLSLFGSLTLYAYFNSAANALTGGTPSASIPASDVLGKVPTGIPTGFTSFTQITPYGGASGLELFLLTSILNFAGNRVDSLNLEINLAATPQLPAATYTGTLTLEALAM